MAIPDRYTLVVGVDAHHLRQLALTWPTWRRHKPSLLMVPMIVFYDHREIFEANVRSVVDHPRLTTIPWPLSDFDLQSVWKNEIESGDKFSDPHRETMLSGFVYVPAQFAKTPYWLKLDTDVVATGMDRWIDLKWFRESPAMVAHRWGFTRPADQMVRMDRWIEENPERMPKEILDSEPLNLTPNPGWNRVNHVRIISWCGLFDSAWTSRMASLTQNENGQYRMPVPSQDGFLWYMAERGGRGIVRTNMKSRGWQHWHTWHNVEKHAREAML